MKLFKQLVSIAVSAVLAALPLAAADFSTNASAGLNGLLTKGVKINSIQIVNASGAAATIDIHDAPVGGTLARTYTNAAFTVTSQSAPASTVTTYTNVFGAVETWTNNAITTALSTNAETVVTYPKLVTFIVANNATATWTPTSPTFATLGLMSSNTAAVTLNINYNR